VLSSSSSGNSAFVRAGETRILLDAGLSRREIVSRLAAIGEDASRLDAILISHEHSDHVSGLEVLAKNIEKERGSKIPIYLTAPTARALDWNSYEPRVELYQAGSRLTLGDVTVDTFTLPHDAADPVGFRLQAQGIAVGFVTDLGYIPDSIKVHIRGCDFLLLESNHDLDMLKVGPYPWSVKQRVMGRKGHLSNDVVSNYIVEELDAQTHTMVLAHLSENNNHPALVEQSATQALRSRNLQTRLVVAHPRRQSEIFEF
jgi:phosphoribosyl 1,2-cyclic phosphodiesterase